MKKLITIILTLTLIMGMSVAGASAKAKKPAKVTGLKAVTKDTQITLTWKKAKRAKKYQVYQLKGKKFVKVRTVKVKKTIFKNLKLNTAYKFKVKAINGKKKGKFSKVVTVRTRKPIVHSGKIDPSKSKVNLVKGDIYTFTNLAVPVKVTITEYINNSDGIIISGTTESGGHYGYVKEDNTVSITIFKEKEYTSHFERDGEEADIDGGANVYIIKDNNTKAYWTLDGTEPQIGQSDLTGYSKWCLIDYSEPYYLGEDRPIEEAYFGALMKYDPIKNPDEKCTCLIKTKLRGTASKGRTATWKEPHNGRRANSWVRVYSNSKLIYEWHCIINRPMPWNEPD